jgi:hypothetical protein
MFNEQAYAGGDRPSNVVRLNEQRHLPFLSGTELLSPH